MMETFVQWATILSPIIAVGLAWWTSRRGARDTARLVMSIKKLTQIHVQITRLQFFKEYEDAYTHSNILYNKYQKLTDHHFQHLPEYFRDQEEKKENVNTDQDYYHKRMDNLSQLMNLLDDMDEAIKKM